MSKLVDVRCGGVTDLYLTPPEDINMRFPSRALACVGFFSRDQAEIEYRGTGFIVCIPGSHKNAFLHIVTAAHVAEGLSGSWIFGMNDKAGGKILLKSGGNPRWWLHPTEESKVDCAVTLFSPAMYGEYDLAYIPQDMLATDSKIAEASIGVGDEVNIVGLFTRFHGKARHVPIVRSGNVAMMPTDPIPTKKYGEMEAYLIEGRSIGGLSGSPVFVRETLHLPGNLEGGKERYLLGQVHSIFSA